MSRGSSDFPVWLGSGVHKARVAVWHTYSTGLEGGGHAIELEAFRTLPMTFGSKASSSAAVALFGSSVIVPTTLKLVGPSALDTDFGSRTLMPRGRKPFPACKEDELHKKHDFIPLKGYIAWYVTKYKLDRDGALVWVSGLFGALEVVLQTKPTTADRVSRVEAGKTGEANLMRARIARAKVATGGIGQNEQDVPEDAVLAHASPAQTGPAISNVAGQGGSANSDGPLGPLAGGPLDLTGPSTLYLRGAGTVGVPPPATTDAARNEAGQIQAAENAHGYARAGVSLLPSQVISLDNDAAETRQIELAAESETSRLWEIFFRKFLNLDTAQELGPSHKVATDAVA